jgi:hypothetical protein
MTILNIPRLSNTQGNYAWKVIKSDNIDFIRIQEYQLGILKVVRELKGNLNNNHLKII